MMMMILYLWLLSIFIMFLNPKKQDQNQWFFISVIYCRKIHHYHFYYDYWKIYSILSKFSFCCQSHWLLLKLEFVHKCWYSLTADDDDNKIWENIFEKFSLLQCRFYLIFILGKFSLIHISHNEWWWLVGSREIRKPFSFLNLNFWKKEKWNLLPGK